MEQEQQVQYLTVRQFADAAGVSTQRVYKALQTSLQPYLKESEGKKYMSSDGLRLFPRSDCQPVANELATNMQPVDNQLQLESQPVAPAEIDILRQTIDTLTAQLAVKDEQISAKDRQISELTTALTSAQDALTIAQTTQKALTDALTAAQALHAGTIQALQQAQQPPQEQPQDTPVVDAEPEQSVPPAEETPDKQETAPAVEQKKCKGFFARIFGKDR